MRVFLLCVQPPNFKKLHILCLNVAGSVRSSAWGHITLELNCSYLQYGLRILAQWVVCIHSSTSDHFTCTIILITNKIYHYYWWSKSIWMPVGVGVQMHAVNTTASLTQPTQRMAYSKLPVVRSQTIAGAEYRSSRLQLNGVTIASPSFNHCLNSGAFPSVLLASVFLNSGLE